MTKKLTSLTSSDLEWRGTTPVSPQYGDIYFSVEGGLAETEHNFIKAVGLPDAWMASEHFTIAETGFGTGLNFLATWALHRQQNSGGTLTFISSENHPLSEDALETAHAQFPELTELAAVMRASYPPTSAGFHLRLFDGGKVRLLLLFGDAAEMLAKLNAKIDAWFLDGFSPAKNPDMWSTALFKQIARLSKSGARLGTFTAARAVFDGLTKAGFTVIKSEGHGNKRNHITATFTSEEQPATPYKTWHSSDNGRQGDVLIIGAGIAGAATAAALKRMGRSVRLLSSEHHECASEVPVAVLSPRFIKDTSPHADFLTASTAHALARQEITAQLLAPSGLTLHPSAEMDEKRMVATKAMLNWPQSWLRSDGPRQKFDKSGTVKSADVLASLLDGIEKISGTVEQMQNHEDHWLVTLTDGSELKANNIVIAAGMGCKNIEATACLPIIANRGQVGIFDAEKLCELAPETHSFGGYLSPEYTDKGKTVRLLGSSFTKWPEDDTNWAGARKEDQQHYIGRLNGATGSTISDDIEAEYQWIGLRATTSDHFPLVGPVPDWAAFKKHMAPYKYDTNIKLKGNAPYQKGLFVLTGMGSKGYQHAFLSAEVIAAMITGTTSPIPHDQEKVIAPARFLVKNIARGN